MEKAESRMNHAFAFDEFFHIIIHKNNGLFFVRSEKRFVLLGFTTVSLWSALIGVFFY